ncbi:hypothetical protein T07_2960 [Trichinella nelsoni]|uniref:Uncharacterized protein n=1 Tax=Trichinella nelsoni TaxID=6336 RepID=A0A0V0RB47_9BILA|nr:hypothetical protein T07_2960 [Trichinella nelsoni]
MTLLDACSNLKYAETKNKTITGNIIYIALKE